MHNGGFFTKKVPESLYFDSFSALNFLSAFNPLLVLKNHHCVRENGWYY